MGARRFRPILRFRDGCLGEVRHADDIPAGIAGNTGNFTASAPDAEIPALLRKGALVALGGQLDFPRDGLALRKQGVQIPRRMNTTGHYILCVFDFGKDASGKVRGPVASASYFVLASTEKRRDLPNGGHQLPYAEDGSNPFEPPADVFGL